LFSYRSNKDAKIGLTFYQNQGKGMKVGEIVVLEVDYNKGGCKWKVNGD
jgi:hypothetical protein